MKTIGLPDFSVFSDEELRDEVDNLTMQWEAVGAALDRGIKEQSNRRADKKKGIIRQQDSPRPGRTRH